MVLKMRETRGSCSSEEILILEGEMRRALPEDYKQFLKNTDGGIPELNEFVIPEMNNSSGVNEFFSSKTLLTKKDVYKDVLLPEAWPIAHAEGGNLVCLVEKDNDWKVCFWDHELGSNDDEPPSWAGMCVLADSFTEFVNSLRPFDPSTVVLAPGQVKSGWIDPDLLKKYGK